MWQWMFILFASDSDISLDSDSANLWVKMLLHLSFSEPFELDLADIVVLANIIALPIGHLAETVVAVGFATVGDVISAERILALLVARQVAGGNTVEEATEQRSEEW